MFGVEEWSRQSRQQKHLQLTVSLSASTVFTGLLALAFRNGFVISFGLNVSMLVGYILVSAAKSSVSESLVEKVDSAQPLVPFVELFPLPSTKLTEPEFNSHDSDDEFVKQSVARLSKSPRTRRRSGSKLQLVPDQDELLRKASLQARLRDRQQARSLSDSEAS